MFAILGIVVVFVAVIGGYLMEKGHIVLLLQPAELLIIAGAASGTVLIANPLHTLKDILKGVAGVFGASRYTTVWYIDSLKLLYDLCDRARRGGLTALEAEIEEPEKGQTFTAHPGILRDRHVCAFICDTFRTMMVGGMDPFDLDQIMETDMEVSHHDAIEPVTALSTMADSLPGLGIVAAVLGVVITMGSLGGPPEQIGEKVAAALVGTFLGILLCYGLVGPLASSMAKMAAAEHAYYHALRVTIAAFSKGIPPILAVEFGRRAIPRHVRPGFLELEKVCRNKTPGPTGQPPGEPPAAQAA